MININSKVPIIGIYKITSPSGKIYIGQSINIQQRKQFYSKLYCKKQRKIYLSLNKYGWEAHQFEIIEECVLSCLDEREIYWKIFYNSVESGLNCGYWDHSPMRGKTHSNFIKNKISKAKTGHICYLNPQRGEKISKAKMGIKQSKEAGILKSLANKGKPKPNGFGDLISKIKKGKPNPKTSIAKRGVPNPNISKSILQYDLQGKYISTHRTQQEASISIGRSNINSKESIGQCCRKVLKTSFGFIWRFETDPLNMDEGEIKDYLSRK